MIKLKKLLNEKLYNSQGEGYTFGKGDIVKDINPDCPHHGAEGEVIKGGKLKITFRVTNNGKNYKEGDELEKTVDQMVKLNSDEISEAKERNYKEEYKKYGSSKKAKKYRAELNAYNRKKGTYGNGDGKDASHKGGKIVGFEAESKNRGRAEKSRLKKEGKLTERIKRFKVYVSGESEPLILMGKDEKEVKKTAHMMIKNSSVKIRKVVKEGKLNESANPVKVKKSVDIIIKELRKRARKLNDDEFYEVTVELKKWFNKNVM